MMSTNIPNGVESPEPRQTDGILNLVLSGEVFLNRGGASPVEGKQIPETHEFAGHPEGQVDVVGSVLFLKMIDEIFVALAGL